MASDWLKALADALLRNRPVCLIGTAQAQARTFDRVQRYMQVG